MWRTTARAPSPTGGEISQNGFEYLFKALDLVAQGKAKTIVETCPWAEAASAYDRVADGEGRSPAALTM